jgi:endonuclease YncB( thermonuclease family)
LVYEGDASNIRNLVTGHLVALGLARVDKRSASKAVSSEAAAAYKALLEEEALAHSDKVGIWRYGDCGDSDDDDRRPVANAWGKKK